MWCRLANDLKANNDLSSRRKMICRYISEVGGGVQPGNRFVSCRACVRACARCSQSGEISAKTCGRPFPFSLVRQYIPFALVIKIFL